MIEHEKMIVEALPSLYPLQKFEEDAVHAVIDALPHWIPVTERLPEGIGRVIAQMDGGAIHDVFYKGKNPYGHVVWVRLDDCIYWDNEVVAWMPLPEPYKGVTEWTKS